MFDPIRSFFTTPPKRATSSLGAGLSGEDDTSPMPAFQKAWKDGATFDDLFGPTPFTLYGAVGRSGAENHRPDVAKVETFLGDAGYYKPLSNDGPSGWHSINLDTAIKSFQKDNGLEVDGLLKPGGPTIGKISSLLGSAADVEAKSEPKKSDPWEQKVGGNDPGDPKKLQPPDWWKPLGEDDDEPDSPDPWPNTVKAALPEGVPVYPDSKVADNSQMFAPRYPRPDSPEEQAKYKQEYDAWLKENWEKIQKNQVLVGQ
ncbi:MAG: peptidoglycan-binding protein, partial [Magnetospirillum sp.]|nr:peptidoglycan-binding protein [Magnetospirillum sp.]